MCMPAWTPLEINLRVTLNELSWHFDFLVSAFYFILFFSFIYFLYIWCQTNKQTKLLVYAGFLPILLWSFEVVMPVLELFFNFNFYNLLYLLLLFFLIQYFFIPDFSRITIQGKKFMECCGNPFRFLKNNLQEYFESP